MTADDRSFAWPASTCGVRLHDLRRYFVGELEDDSAHRIAEHTKSCDECRARLTELEEGRRRFQAQTNIAAESAAVLAKLDAATAPPSMLETWRHLLSRRAVQLAAVAATVLVAVGLPLMLGPGTNETPHNRIKGGASLMMYVADAEGVRPGGDGIVLHQGDRIQFKYRASGHRHLMVVSVDSRGVISPLYPDVPGPSIPVQPNGSHVLEGSIVLDEAVGPERIFAFFSADPLRFEDVRKVAAERLDKATDVTGLHSLGLGNQDVEEATILFIKE